MPRITEPVCPIAARLQPIPFAALTGFRVAGKATLLKRLLLERPEPAYTSALINESGRIGLEARAGSGRRVRRVVVGPTGLANPAPVLQTQMSHPVALRSFRLDGAAIVVDAANGDATPDAQAEAARQAAIADRLALTKADPATPSTRPSGSSLGARARQALAPRPHRPRPASADLEDGLKAFVAAAQDATVPFVAH